MTTNHPLHFFIFSSQDYGIIFFRPTDQIFNMIFFRIE